MQLKMFSIFDSAVKAYNQPFFMLTQAEALRAFTNLATDPQSNISRNPSDYHLFFLGTYDNTTGYVNQDEKVKDLGPATLYQKEDTTVEELFPAKEVSK